MIPSGSRILLDTVAFIYFLESHPRYSKIAEAIFRRIESSDLQAVMSSLVLTELMVPLYRVGDEQTATGLSNRLQSFSNLELINVNTEVALAAARLRATYGFRTPDAIHCATAFVSEASGILTNDKQWRKVAAPDMEVWLFDDLDG